MTKEEIRSQEWVDKIEGLVRRAEAIPDADARNVTIQLLRAVLAFHAAGIERLMDIVFESGAGGQRAIEQAAADDLVGSMLLLHDLHPDDLETRVQRAVERLQDVFRSLGTRLSIIAIEPPSLRLHFDSQRSWPGDTVRASIDKAIFHAAPEITTVILEGLKETASADFVPVSELLAAVRV